MAKPNQPYVEVLFSKSNNSHASNRVQGPGCKHNELMTSTVTHVKTSAVRVDNVQQVYVAYDIILFPMLWKHILDCLLYMFTVQCHQLS